LAILQKSTLKQVTWKWPGSIFSESLKNALETGDKTGMVTAWSGLLSLLLKGMI